MPCPRVPTQIVAFCVMVSLLLLRRLPRNPQGLSHRLANRHKGVLFRGGGAEHPVVGHGDRQPGIGIRPPDRSPCTGMAKGPRVRPRRDYRQGWARIANARHEMEATDAAVVGHALHVVIITRRTRHAEAAHPLLRQKAHPIQRPTLGEHGEGKPLLSAVELARTFGAQLHVLTVVREIEAILQAKSAPLGYELIAVDLENRIAALIRRVNASDLKPNILVRHSASIYAEILRAAEEAEADLIVVGSHQ